MKRSPLIFGLLTSAVFAAAPAYALPTAQTPKPAAAEQPTASAIKLTLQDLPPGFQELPPEAKTIVAAQLEAFKAALPIEKLPLDNLFAFVEPDKLQVVVGFTDQLPDQSQQAKFDAGLQQIQQPGVVTQLVSKFKQQIQQLKGFELSDAQLLPQQASLGNTSAGMTVAVGVPGLPLRMDITSFRRGNVIAFTGVAYMDKTKPLVSINDVASKLDSRIVKSSPAAKLPNRN